jgi:bacteriorhodopsin
MNDLSNIKNDHVISVFHFSLSFMIFAFLFTLVSTIIVKKPELRRILYLECIVTFVSCCVYTLFNIVLTNVDTLQLTTTKKEDLFALLNTLRYIGWYITTPIMMSVMSIVMANNLKMSFPSLNFLLFIVFLDYIMLFFGILGEIGVIDLIPAMILGFIPFLIMFYIVFMKYVYGKKNTFNNFLFAFYFVLWTSYGMVYIINPETKTITTNSLDITSKGFLAIILSIMYVFKK